MAPKKYPHDITFVSPEEEKLIVKCIYGYLKCGTFVKVGPQRYVLPAKFRRCAEYIYNMRVRPDDTWVITFPRSGTTWTQEMVWLLQNDLDFKTAKEVPLYERFPQLIVTAQIPDLAHYLIRANFMNLANFQGLDAAIRQPSWEAIDHAPSPRFIKTHLPLSLLPPNLLDVAKVVYVARDPRDVAVSYYYLQKHIGKGIVRASFMEFWEAFRKDLLPFTPVVAHANEAWQKRNHKNLHFIFYEDLKKDLSLEVRSMCKFLGREYSDLKLSLLVDHLAFDNLKKNKTVNNNLHNDQKAQFIRKGEIGGWVEHFDEKMVVQAQEYLRTRLAKVDVRYPTIPCSVTDTDCWESEKEVTHL
ncbi:hypothetical protein JYU34_012430 [Plutella xylostella]|uniref:Sulfotransferase domain-containing protein n=1 Tax=Plutella xylostella TaxID=51655 RepID=A0ABQ7QBC4_PLUXY|nr:hypothetical protein JYU34_012430 [Plutella xylostella]